MTKQVHVLKTKHRTWTLEVYDRPDAVHILVIVKGKWHFAEELEFNEWFGALDFPYRTKAIISTFLQTGEVLTHYPNGMVVKEQLGLPTEVNFCQPP